MSDQSENSRQMRRMAIIFAPIGLLLVAAYFFFLRDDFIPFLSGLEPGEMNVVVTELEAAGIGYELSADGSAISIPSRRQATARLALSSADIGNAALDGFELFDESDMGLTDFSQRIKYQRALQGELTRTIMMLEGIADVRVHIAISERTLFRREEALASAAVSLAMQEGYSLSEERVEGIQRLVAASVPGLVAEEVVVLGGEGSVVSVLYQAPVMQLAENDGAPQSQVMQFRSILQDVLDNDPFDLVLERTPIVIEHPVEEPDNSEANNPVVSNATGLNLTVITAQPLSTRLQRLVQHRFSLVELGALEQVSNLAFRYDPTLRSSPEAELSEGTQPTAQPVNAAVGANPAVVPSTSVWVMVGSLVLILIAAIVGVLWWFWGRATLSSDQHDELAQRIKRELLSYQEAGNAS